jgi:hypothetical protein
MVNQTSVQGTGRTRGVGVLGPDRALDQNELGNGKRHHVVRRRTGTL